MVARAVFDRIKGFGERLSSESARWVLALLRRRVSTEPLCLTVGIGEGTGDGSWHARRKLSCPRTTSGWTDRFIKSIAAVRSYLATRHGTREDIRTPTCLKRSNMLAIHFTLQRDKLLHQHTSESHEHLAVFSRKIMFWCWVR